MNCEKAQYQAQAHPSLFSLSLSLLSPSVCVRSVIDGKSKAVVMGGERSSKEEEERKKKKKRSSVYDSGDDRKRKKRRSLEEEEAKSSKTKKKDKSKRSKNSHRSSKHRTDKAPEKKSKEKQKSKRSKHDDQSKLNFQVLSMDDYFSKNNEFATWLKEEKNMFFSDLSSESAHDLFSHFVKDWNSHELESRYYKGIETAPRSAHKWKIKQ